MNRIYVFSSTGTSLQVAKDIANEIEDSEIISIPGLMKRGKWNIEGDMIGFVFPCYYGQAPMIVSDFIQNADRVDAKYAFGVTTAGENAGYSNIKLGEYLADRGIELSYGAEISIASNYMNGWYYNMLMPKKSELEERIKISKERCRKIGRDVGNMVKSEIKGSYKGYKLPRIISPNRYVKDTRAWDCEFSVNSNCSGCGTCSKVCPVDNIEIKNGKPAFKHNCQRCMACIQYCKKSTFRINGKPMNKPKYFHPEVDVKEIIQFNS